MLSMKVGHFRVGEPNTKLNMTSFLEYSKIMP